jgi:hypothetical protein
MVERHCGEADVFKAERWPWPVLTLYPCCRIRTEDKSRKTLSQGRRKVSTVHESISQIAGRLTGCLNFVTFVRLGWRKRSLNTSPLVCAVFKWSAYRSGKHHIHCCLNAQCLSRANVALNAPAHGSALLSLSLRRLPSSATGQPLRPSSLADTR